MRTERKIKGMHTGSLVTFERNAVNSTCPDSVMRAWTATYAADTASSENIPTAITTDNLGNVYVTGTSDSGFINTDYLTVKYNSAGQQQWAVRYNGPGDDDDFATAIAVDIDGNVYVTGTSYDTLSYYDVTTIKYNLNGVRQWVNRYNGPDNDDDGAVAIAIDQFGNVAVTGPSFGKTTFFDWVTIKYFTGGTTAWTKRYNGPLGDDDVPSAITMDGSGNVYVTGYTYSLDNYLDFLTIKYLSANGSQAWLAQYDGPEHDEDVATAIAVDALGDAFVTGYSAAVAGVVTYDYATVKYNPSGLQRWVMRYNGPGDDDDVPSAIRVDALGNVIVTGHSFGLTTFDDIATISYSSIGAQQWVTRYNGAANDDDGGTSLTLDAQGTIYVTGYSYAPGSFFDFVTLAYNANGIRQWVERFNGTGTDDDQPAALSIDGNKNLLVTGFSTSAASGDYVYATLKYTTQLPCFSVAQSSFLFDTTQVSCRRVDTVIVRNGGTVSLVISSVSSDDASFTVSPQSRTIDPSDSALFMITFGPLSTGPKIGHIIFVHNARSAPDSLSIFGGGVVGGTGIVIHSGLGANWQLLSLPVSTLCPYVFPNAFLFDPLHGYVRTDTLVNGRAYWKKLTIPDLTFTGYPILIDTFVVHAGWNIVGSISIPAPVAGIIMIPDSIVSSPFYRFTGASYAVSDTLKPGRGYWAKTRQAGLLIVGHPAANRKPSFDNDLLLRSDVLTITDADENSQQLFFSRRRSDGVFADYYELPPPPPEGIFDVRFASGRMLEVVGDLPEQEFPILISSVRYPVTISWRANGQGAPVVLRVGENETVLEGEGELRIANPDIARSVALVLSPKVAKPQPTEFSLVQNFPNPFNPTTTIKYQIPTVAPVQLRLYDVLGREIRTLVNEMQQPGYYSVPLDASLLSSGIYFYSLTAGNAHVVKKMVLLK